MSFYRTLVALSIKGDRIEKGQEIDLSDEDVASLDPADIVSVAGETEPTEEEEQDVPLEEMTQAQLKARAKELGLKQSGSVADLRERIGLAQDALDKMVDHLITEEDVASHPEWFEARPDGSVAKVGDTIKIPPEDISSN